MKPSNTQPIARRKALVAMIKAPFSLALQDVPDSQPSSNTEELLAHAKQEIATSWQQSRGYDLAGIEEALSPCLKQVEYIARTYPAHRLVAAHLASQGWQLAGILASHHHDYHARDLFCRRAVSWAQLTNDPTIQVTALTKLGVNFSYMGLSAQAKETYQVALPFLDRASPLSQSSLSMKLAEAHAQQGEGYEAEHTLDLAYQQFPEHVEDDPAFLYADSDRPSLSLWNGLTHLALNRTTPSDRSENEHVKLAWQAFEPFGGSRPERMISARNHLEILNYQAETAVVMDDLERFSCYFQEAAKGIQMLASAKRLREASRTYWKARRMWPHEQRVTELAELLIVSRV